MKINFTVNEDFSLYEALSKTAPLSSNSVKKLISSREVRVNGVRVESNVALKAGDEVMAFIPEKFMGKMPEIVYEDENILIADKPELIEVEPTLTDMLKKERTFFKPLHRLDRNTLGLVVFALNQNAYDELYKAFEMRNVEKRYRALVVGSIKSGEYSAYLYKDKERSKSYVYSSYRPDCKKIITKIEVIKKGEISELEIKLITGRTHQIRAHLAFLGCPVLGDGKYGSNEANNRYKCKYQKLCAYKLIFHNLSGKMGYLNEKVFFSKQKLLTK